MFKSFNKSIFKLFGKIAFIAAVALILDLAIGATLRHFYFTQTSGAFYRTTYAMDSTYANILIFGSSRANHHYDPRIFEQELGMSCYNTGRDGNFLLYNYAVFETIIKRFTPKIVIFDLNKDELSSTFNDYERLSSLLPYKGRNAAIDRMIALRNPYEKLKLLSALYPYNSLLLTIAIGNTEMNKTRKSDINGYVPLTGIWKKHLPILVSGSKLTTDSNKAIALQEIINDCKSKGIRLILVNSPAFLKIGNAKSKNLIEEIALKNKVEYIDYSEEYTFLNNHTYFVDPGHLNQDGAKLFSTLLTGNLKNGKISN